MLFKNSFKFPNIFNLDSGSTNMDTQHTSINRCIALILTTAPGELLGDPNFGCGLYEKLFDVYTQEESDLIKDDIVTAITNYEKRVIIRKEDITIDTIPGNDHKYNIHITYNLKNSDVTSEASLVLSEEDYNWQMSI